MGAAIPVIRESINWIAKQAKVVRSAPSEVNQTQRRIGLSGDMKDESQNVLQIPRITNRSAGATNNQSKIGGQLKQAGEPLHKTHGYVR